MKSTKKAILLLMALFLALSCSKDDDNGGTEPNPENRAPEDFELVSAPDGATDVDRKPQFTWEEAEDPDGDEVTYSLFLGKNPSSLTEIAGDISDTNFSLENNLDLTTDYYWYVLASDGNGGETQSKTFSFTTRKLNDAVQATPSAGFKGTLGIRATVFGENLWAIGGGIPSMSYGEVWFTADGTTWSQTPNLPSPISYHDVVTYDGKMWVLCGHDGNTWVSKVMYSENGIFWGTKNGSLPARASHTALVFDDKIWIIGGRSSINSTKDDVWYSTDGQNWTEATANADFSSRYGHTSVVYDGKMWVIGGKNASGYLNDVWYSSDGVTWIEAASSAGFHPRSWHISLVYGGKMWVIAGRDNNNNFNDVWASTDGVEWEQVYTSAAFTPRVYMAGAVFDDKIWIIGGLDDEVWYME